MDRKKVREIVISMRNVEVSPENAKIVKEDKCTISNTRLDFLLKARRNPT
jgi:hypothetical protein